MRDILESQDRMQNEADEVVRLLRLDDLLGRLGTPVRVGSSAMGLMVARDIDITVVCRSLDDHTLRTFSGIAAELMQSTTVASIRFRNETGTWNSEPEKYPDGLYLGLTVHDQTAAEWTLDIWAIAQPARQPDLEHLRSLLPRLSQENRRTILRLKHSLAERPKEAKVVPSILIYKAVVDHNVETMEQFDEWLEKNGSQGVL